jgi:hypothetical protein
MIDLIMAVEPVRWLGDTIGFWVQTATIAISAASAIWFGLIRAPEKQAMRSATVDIIIDQSRDQGLINARQIIREIRERQDESLACFVKLTDSPVYKAILLVLNNYEFVAAGIRVKCWDERVYKRLRYSTALRDWESLSEFVVAFRHAKGIPTLFQDFEWLYTRWKRSPLEPQKRD